MKKKIIALLLAGVMSCGFAAVAGCGDGSDAGDGGGNDGIIGGGNGGEDGDGQEKPAVDTSEKLSGKVYVVGDSTLCGFNDNYYLPRYGYGTQLYNYINCEPNQIVNLALSGRSSLSFLTEENYNTLKSSIGAGDYLIIGFGHNDEKYDDSVRYTNPSKDYTDSSAADGPSFQYTLYESYVKLAKEKQATPILCTPIVRYDGTGAYTGNSVHVTIKGDYAAAVKALGAATDTAVVDLTTLTKELYKSDNETAKYFHAHPTYSGEKPDEKPAGIDATHLNKFGAKAVAYLFADAVKASDCALKANIRTNSAAPTKAVDYPDAIKAEYVRPDYSPFNPADTTAKKLTDDWYATAMGDLGGASVTPFKIGYANEKFTFAVDDGKGKFDTTADGFGAAFMQVDAKKNFTVSADVTITGIGINKPNQSAFGIMLRDDIYINKTTKGDGLTLNSNYVAAGAFGDGSGAIFCRENTKLIKESNSVGVAVGATFAVSIERIGQAVNVKIGNYTKTYTDFDFIAVDNAYMYVCLFANRGISAEFTNVNFRITGDAQGA